MAVKIDLQPFGHGDIDVQRDALHVLATAEAETSRTVLLLSVKHAASVPQILPLADELSRTRFSSAFSGSESSLSSEVARQ